MEPDTEDVTLVCDAPGCDAGEDGGAWSVTAPRSGQGSAPLRLGTHKWTKHRIKGQGKKARPGSTQEDLEARPVLTVVKSTAQAVGGRGAPTAAALSKGLGEGLSLTTSALAAVLAETDPHIKAEQQVNAAAAEQSRRDLVDYLTLPPDSAEDLMGPIARLVAPTNLNKKYGRAAIDNVGVISSVVDLGRLFAHYKSYFAVRSQPPMAASPMVAPQFRGADVPAGTSRVSSTGPAGHVVTPDEVQELIRQRDRDAQR